MSEYCVREFGTEPASVIEHDTIKHGFTHFQLDIQPVEATLPGTAPTAVHDADRQWATPEVARALGLPKPVRALLGTVD